MLIIFILIDIEQNSGRNPGSFQKARVRENGALFTFLALFQDKYDALQLRKPENLGGAGCQFLKM